MPTLAEVAADLYTLPPGEMIAARDARVRALRADGEPELADRVRRLRKPSTSAWVVDHLAFAEPQQVEQVVDLGARLRAAQDDLDAALLRELAGERRRLVAAVAARARDLAVEAGLPVSDSAVAQVEATLTAALLDDVAARALRSGLLVAPLRAGGAEDVASVVAVPEALGLDPVAGSDGGSAVRDAGRSRSRHLRVVPDAGVQDAGGTGGREVASGSAAPPAATDPAAEDRAREREEELAAAREDLAAARDDVAAAQEAGRTMLDEADRLESAARRVEAEQESLRRRLGELDDEAEAVQSELTEIMGTRGRTERTVADAERRRDEAEARLRRLEQS